MVRKMVRFSFALMLVMLTAGTLPAQVFPKLIGSVNDFANVLSPDDVRALALTLRVYRNTTDIAVVVATVPSLGGVPMEKYALRLFNQWGIGEKGKDNGILLLLAPTEQQVRIEVGYGLEKDLSDAIAVEIIQKYAVPNFRAGNFSAGLKATVDGIIIRLDERQRKK